MHIVLPTDIDTICPESLAECYLHPIRRKFGKLKMLALLKRLACIGAGLAEVGCWLAGSLGGLD